MRDPGRGETLLCCGAGETALGKSKLPPPPPDLVPGRDKGAGPPYPPPPPDPGRAASRSENRLRVCCWNFCELSFIAREVTAGGGTPRRWT